MRTYTQEEKQAVIDRVIAQGTVLCVLPFIHPFSWKCTPLTVVCTPPM